MEFWATLWIRDKDKQHALAEGTSQALDELGRAEAEGELILSISDELKTTPYAAYNTNSVRNILIHSTVQILEDIYGLCSEENS